jgi:PAS domain S-box-containing protein
MDFTEEIVQRALRNGEFIPHFQPLVDLRAGRIQGFEILARWQHPTRGLISPIGFIPLIERSGLIDQLTTSMLTQAFAAVRTLPTNFGLSINLAPCQLHDRAMPDYIHRLADEAEFDLKRLTVELTETALVDDLVLAGAVAADFKRLNVRLSLDDFGTGYSSLLHLQSLPFDELKVDISFVRSMVQSRQSRKITAAVLSLGLSLGLKTVAEGIEDHNQANLLAWQGCNLGQGFLYGRAVAAADLLAALIEDRPSTGTTADVPASIADPFLALDAQPTERLSQLHAIYNCAPIGLAFVNLDLRYVNLNERLAQLNRQTVHAHLGRKISEMAPPELFAQFEPYLKRALKGESFPSIEVRKSFPDQPPITFLVSYQPVRDEAGEILGVCISIADISALKQKDEALRESEDHYRNAAELSPQIPWLMDPCGNNISVTSRWETLTGLNREETKGRGWLKAIHPDDQPLVLAALETSLPTGVPVDLQYRVRCCAGNWEWMRSRGAPRRDATGKIIRWYGSVESIDEYKRVIDQLRGSEARLRAIFDVVPIGVVLADACTGKVLNANPQAEQLIGFQFKPDMVWSTLGWSAFDSSGHAIGPSSLPLIRAINSGHATGPEELLLHRPDGSSIWLNVTAAPICLDNGTRLGAVLAVQEIGTRKPEHDRLVELAHQLLLATSTSSDSPGTHSCSQPISPMFAGLIARRRAQ